MDRFFATPVDAAYDLRLTALPRPGGALPLARPVTASASTVLTGDVTVGAHAAVDGDPAHRLARGTDRRRPDAAAGLAGRAHARPDPARRAGRAGRRAADGRCCCARRPAEVAADVGADGWVTFPALTTDRIEIVVTASDPVVADPRGNGWPAPVGVAEVEVPALAGLLHRRRRRRRAVAAPCGSGPTVELDGVAYPTSVSGTVADVRAGRSLPVTVCDDFASRVGAAAGRGAPAAYRALGVVRDRTAVLTPRRRCRRRRPTPVRSPCERWDATDRSVTVGPARRRCWWCRRTSTPGWTATPRRGAAAGGAGRRVAAGVRGAGGRGRRGDADVHAGPAVPRRAGRGCGGGAARRADGAGAGAGRRSPRRPRCRAVDPRAAGGSSCR